MYTFHRNLHGLPLNAEPTPGNDCLGFGKWLDEQLALWEKDEDKKCEYIRF